MVDSIEETYPDVFRILSIDPGSYTMGVAISEYDFDANIFKVIDATTISLDKLIDKNSTLFQVHGEKVARLVTVESAISKMLFAWRPSVVVCESPYMGQFPQAFASLVECVSSVRRAVMRYVETLPLHVIDPATVKKNVGVSGKSGDKDKMSVAITKQSDLSFSTDVNVEELDEHSVDAVAVGYAYYRMNIVKG